MVARGDETSNRLMERRADLSSSFPCLFLAGKSNIFFSNSDCEVTLPSLVYLYFRRCELKHNGIKLNEVYNSLHYTSVEYN